MSNFNSEYFFDYDNVVYEEFMRKALDYRTRHHLATKKQCAFKCAFKSGNVVTYYPDLRDVHGRLTPDKHEQGKKYYKDAPNYEQGFFHRLNACGIDMCRTDALTYIEKVNL